MYSAKRRRRRLQAPDCKPRLRAPFVPMTIYYYDLCTIVCAQLNILVVFFCMCRWDEELCNCVVAHAHYIVCIHIYLSSLSLTLFTHDTLYSPLFVSRRTATDLWARITISCCRRRPLPLPLVARCWSIGFEQHASCVVP